MSIPSNTLPAGQEPENNPANNIYGANPDPAGEEPKTGEDPKQTKGLGESKDPKNPDGEKSPEEKAKEEELKQLFGKPETYDYKELLPEGMELNKEVTEKFNSIAEKLNLSQKGASDLMALAVELTQQAQSNTQEAINQAFEAKKAEYIKALESDKEIGGFKLEETLTVANLAYEKFATKEVQDLLAESGLNAHPQVVKMFNNIGKQIKEDTIHDGSIPNGTKLSEADIIYGQKNK